MQLDTTEQKIITECQQEAAAWAGWERCFLGAGVLLIGFGVLALWSLSAISNPQDVPAEAKQATNICLIVALLLGVYFIDSGMQERRERKWRGLLLKFANQVGEQPKAGEPC